MVKNNIFFNFTQFSTIKTSIISNKRINQAKEVLIFKTTKKKKHFFSKMTSNEIDVFKFSSLKVFDSIKENLPDEAREIADVHEDLLFVWNFKESNLQVVNFRAAQAIKNANNAKIQV